MPVFGLAGRAAVQFAAASDQVRDLAAVGVAAPRQTLCRYAIGGMTNAILAPLVQRSRAT
jgi:hypothetical protein